MKIKHSLLVFSLLLAAMMIFTACERPPSLEQAVSSQPEIMPKPYPVSVGGITFEESPQKIICLSPYLTEALFELGYKDRLIGTSTYCDYPEQAKELPSFGSGASPAIDEIIAASPDMLLCQSELSLMDKSRLEGEGIKVLTIPSPPTITALYQVYTSLAAVVEGKVDADASAREVYTDIDIKVAEIMAKDYGFESFAYIAAPNMAIATADTLESQVLSLFAVNAADDGEATGYEFSLEKLAKADPDIVFIASPMTIDKLKNNASLAALSAVKAGRVIVIDNMPFERPSTRIIKQLEFVDNALLELGGQAD